MYKYTLISLLLLFFFPGCISEDTGSREGSIIGIGDKLPSLDITLSDGSPVNDEILKNKVVVVLLFTTQCPDCRQQFPAVEELYLTFKEREDVVLFGISRKDMDVADYWKDHGLTFPYSAQPDAKLYNQFAYTTVPRIYITGKKGEVHRMFDDDPVPDYNVLRNSVMELLN